MSGDVLPLPTCTSLPELSCDTGGSLADTDIVHCGYTVVVHCGCTAVVHCGILSPVVCTLAEVLAEAEGGEGDAAQAAGHHGGQAAAL